MYDPRLTEPARKLIQDIHFTQHQPNNRFVATLHLSAEEKLHAVPVSGGESACWNHPGAEETAFAQQLERKEWPAKYDKRVNNITLHMDWPDSVLPSPGGNFELFSLQDNDCNTREDIAKAGAEIMVMLAEKTGIPVEELLGKVNLRKIPHAVNADELLPHITALMAAKAAQKR